MCAVDGQAQVKSTPEPVVTLACVRGLRLIHLASHCSELPVLLCITETCPGYQGTIHPL